MRRTGQRKRRRLGPVVIECRMEKCGWTGSAPAWRKARRLRSSHIEARHG